MKLWSKMCINKPRVVVLLEHNFSIKCSSLRPLRWWNNKNRVFEHNSHRCKKHSHSLNRDFHPAESTPPWNGHLFVKIQFGANVITEHILFAWGALSCWMSEGRMIAEAEEAERQRKQKVELGDTVKKLNHYFFFKLFTISGFASF